MQTRQRGIVRVHAKQNRLNAGLRQQSATAFQGIALCDEADVTGLCSKNNREQGRLCLGAEARWTAQLCAKPIKCKDQVGNKYIHMIIVLNY
jgi:hypothetical protein